MEAWLAGLFEPFEGHWVLKVAVEVVILEVLPVDERCLVGSKWLCARLVFMQDGLEAHKQLYDAKVRLIRRIGLKTGQQESRGHFLLTDSLFVEVIYVSDEAVEFEIALLPQVLYERLRLFENAFDFVHIGVVFFQNTNGILDYAKRDGVARVYQI